MAAIAEVAMTALWAAIAAKIMVCLRNHLRLQPEILCRVGKLPMILFHWRTVGVVVS